MSQTQWLLLILVVVVVAGAYLYIRRNADDDPWQGMEEDESQGDEDITSGVSLGGDSYIVGVRTIGASEEDGTPAQPAPRRADPTPTPERPSYAPKDKPRQKSTDKAMDNAADDFGKGFGDKPVAPPQEARKQPPKGSGAKKARPPWAAFSPSSRAPKQPEQVDTSGVEQVRPQRPPAGEQKLFIVHVASRDQSFFDGPDVHAALQAQKLKFGLHNIYHRITEVNGVPDSVYSIANMLKPGFLDPVEQDHLSTPGLTMFLQLPGPIDGARATRDLLETAGGLAEHLGGEVLDDKRSLLKAQTAQYMLDEAAEMDRRQRLQAQR